MNLEFLYYQQKGILDGRDPKMEKLKPSIDLYYEALNNSKIEDVIGLIIKPYREQYAQFKYLFMGLYKAGSHGLKVTYPSFVDLEKDYYLPVAKMNRTDISYVFFNNFDDEDNTNALFLDELVLSFVDEENGIATAVETALSGLDFSKEAVDNGFLYKLTNTPILEISVAPQEFRMKLNPEHWEVYV